MLHRKNIFTLFTYVEYEGFVSKKQNALNYKMEVIYEDQQSYNN